ncbi:CSH1 [Candida theae]|uniref:inositol phosphorylceramide mannosyltransferase n=1 Tax=Candida theae TaxID=1198502 RepID=A0AAD5BBK7_9ASCO|nr:CSH1 [Candida theae]KAI5949445.1 CSH1 [Candida theae]
MRKELKYIIYAHVILVVYLLYLSFDLLTLLHDDSYADALIDYELNSQKLDKPQLIPKIIHQTYKNENIPEIWKPGQQACIDLHEDYQYILWTDEMAREFISEEFPWFLETWDKYPYNIQRADAIRYFALYHYGGIYIDLDDGCERRLDPLLTVPAFVRKTIPTGISNDVMGSVPNHPFFLKAMESLKNYQRNWLVPYITIMISTGPLFLSVIWKQYKRWGVPEAGKVRVLMPQNYKGYQYSFFAIAPGSSWHMSDANFIKSLANHLVLAVIGGFCIALVILGIEYLFYSFIVSSFFKKCTAKVGNSILALITGILRFFNLDKFVDSHLKDYTFLSTSPIGNDDEESQLGEVRPKRGISLKNFLKNSSVKRRSRKDSNIPIEIDILEKLADDPATIVITSDSAPASALPKGVGSEKPKPSSRSRKTSATAVKDKNNLEVVETLRKINSSEESEFDNEEESGNDSTFVNEMETDAEYMQAYSDLNTDAEADVDTDDSRKGSSR